TRAHLAWSAGAHQCPAAARDLATMIVSVGVERLFAHLSTVELTLPPDQLPWRSGPAVRGLRLLPVRYELRAGSASVCPAPPTAPPRRPPAPPAALPPAARAALVRPGGAWPRRAALRPAAPPTTRA